MNTGKFECFISDNIRSMTSREIYTNFHRQYSIKLRVVRVILSIFLLIIGGLIYIAYREQSLVMFHWVDILKLSDTVSMFRVSMSSYGIYGWIKNSLPDGLWLFAYMLIVDAIWNGAKMYQSYVFIFGLPVFALLSEFAQSLRIIPGVFDWIDVMSYISAVLLFLLMKILK